MANWNIGLDDAGAGAFAGPLRPELRSLQVCRGFRACFIVKFGMSLEFKAFKLALEFFAGAGSSMWRSDTDPETLCQFGVSERWSGLRVCQRPGYHAGALDPISRKTLNPKPAWAVLEDRAGYRGRL